MVTPPSIALVGHPFAPIGMGEHVRSSWRAFSAAGAEAQVFDIYGLCDRSDPDLVRVFGPAEARSLSTRLNVFHINGDEVANVLAHLEGKKKFERNAYNIVYPAWELARFPAEWARELDRFDEIWAPSAFIRDAISSVAKKPVMHMPLAVDVRMSSFLTRRALGLPESAFLYLFFFDFTSYMSRKNPFAILEAFEALVNRHPEAPLCLVLKHKGGDAPEAVVKLKAAMQRLPGQIHVIDRTLHDNEVRNLVRACDCFVSLHRSEGFGRGLAEAMALGVPVVGTGYSGNLDFMNEQNAWLVEYDLVPVAPGEYPHGDGQVWAAARLESAIELMERVFIDRAGAMQKANRAMRDLRCYFSPRAVGLRYVNRVNDIKSDLAESA